MLFNPRKADLLQFSSDVHYMSETQIPALKEEHVGGFFVVSQATAAKIAILSYLILAITGPFGLLIPPSMIDSDSAANTVGNIQGSDLQLRISVILGIFGQVSFIFVGLGFYSLFKPVDEHQSAILLVFVLVAVPMAIANYINLVAALHLSGNPSYLGSVDSATVDAQVLFFMNMFEFGVVIVSIFWGLWLLPLGYLSYKSDYVPKILGILVMINGVGYVFDVIHEIVLSGDSAILGTLIEISLFVGELPYILWILVMGFNLADRRVRLWS